MSELIYFPVSQLCVALRCSAGRSFAVSKAVHVRLVVASARCFVMVGTHPSLDICWIALVGECFSLRCHSLAFFCRVVDLVFG